MALSLLYTGAIIGTWLGRALAAQNFPVPWSKKYYGPDGPWQAVQVTLGGNNSALGIGSQNVTAIDMYPGGVWATLAMDSSSCVKYPDTLCGAGGTWTPDENQLQYEQHISIKTGWVEPSWGVNVTGASYNHLGLSTGGQTVWNATLAWAAEGNVTYPNGVVGGVPLGHFSLGADSSQYQYFTLSDKVGDGIVAWLFAGYLFNQSVIPSYTYGLHIGSAAFDYPGSLVFGGYNKGRVIAPVTTSSDVTVDLIDISIGVEFGDSPLNATTNITGLLSGGQTKVLPDPLDPYLSLPGDTCDRIAKHLPVTFDDHLKYYTWNINDPLYTEVVTSPAYLGFTFPPEPGDSENVIIKVPFALLNLTLTKPITDTQKQYFPCLRYDPHGNDTPRLGRAFLQAAFIGRNWQTKTSWLAQAPGPGTARAGLGDQNTDITEGATTIEGFSGANLFNQSWSGHWSVKQSQQNNPNVTSSDTPSVTPNGTSHGGLSVGAKAGIGVGTALGTLALLVALILLWRRRSGKQTDAAKVPFMSPAQPTAYTDKSYNAQQMDLDEWDPSKVVHELPQAMLPARVQTPVEAPDTSR